MSDSDKMVKPYTYSRMCTEVRVNWKALCLCDIDIWKLLFCVRWAFSDKYGEGEDNNLKEEKKKKYKKESHVAPNVSS